MSRRRAPAEASGDELLPARLGVALRGAVRRGELSSEDAAQVLARLRPAGRAVRGDKQARRDDILAAATRIFATKGYHATTLQDIADELGLTRPAFYYYFQSKQVILEAICLRAADHTDALIADALAHPAPNRASLLHHVFAAYAAHIAVQETTAIMMRNYEEMSLPIREELTERRRRREGAVTDVLRAGIAAGELTHTHPRIAVLSIFEMLHSVHSWFDASGPLSREQIGDLLARQILAGLLPR